MPIYRHKIRAVVFDLDDTLFAEVDYVRSGYLAVAEHVRRSAGRSDAYEDWLWSRFLGGKTKNAFDELNEHFKLGFDSRQIMALVELYRNHRPDIRAFDGAGEMLSQFSGYFKLGLLSDGTLPGQEFKLDAVKLRPFFNAVIFTESLGRDAWKPSTKGFGEIRRLLDVPHDCCAYVADNPAKDFVAPNALGWRSIQYLRPGQIHADNPLAAGGQPQIIIHQPGSLWEALI